MPLGPGKYDQLCTIAREAAKAEGAMLIVIHGQFGNGFSVQASAEATVALPSILRQVADSIERAFKQGEV